MNYAEALSKLETMENGQEILNAIKGETSRLNSESKKNREMGQANTKKLADILTALGLTDDDSTVDSVKSIKTNLDEYKATNKTPSDIQKELVKLTTEITNITNQLNQANEKAKAEKDKRISSMKHSTLVDILSKNKCVSSDNIAKLLVGNLTVDDNDTLSYVNGDNTVSVEDGVNSWLKENQWAVGITSNQGGGSLGGNNTPATNDLFLQGFNK